MFGRNRIEQGKSQILFCYVFQVIAKLVCARHKPNQQTIIPPQYVSKVYETTSISSVRNLGGKLGKALTDAFGIRVRIIGSMFISFYRQWQI